MSAPINDSGPAFPISIPEGNGCGPYANLGMTLRDYFAGQALAGYTSMECLVSTIASGVVSLDTVANSCYAYADAMLAARSRSTTEPHS